MGIGGVSDINIDMETLMLPHIAVAAHIHTTIQTKKCGICIHDIWFGGETMGRVIFLVGG